MDKDNISYSGRYSKVDVSGLSLKFSLMFIFTLSMLISTPLVSAAWYDIFNPLTWFDNWNFGSSNIYIPQKSDFGITSTAKEKIDTTKDNKAMNINSFEILSQSEPTCYLEPYPGDGWEWCELIFKIDVSSEKKVKAKKIEKDFFKFTAIKNPKEIRNVGFTYELNPTVVETSETNQECENWCRSAEVLDSKNDCGDTGIYCKQPIKTYNYKWVKFPTSSKLTIDSDYLFVNIRYERKAGSENIFKLDFDKTWLTN